jgi:RNA polymerase sigma factor (sigma-70 family)
MSDERRDEDRERDADLLGRVRGGDEQAYAELWERYAPAAAAVARSYWWSADADDLVAESFTRIYQAIQAGKGPTAAFKPYLFATMRNLAISWGRARREVPIEYIEAVEDPNSTDAAADADFDASLVSQAILALPERWQDVLWFGEVEHLSMHEIGKRLTSASAPPRSSPSAPERGSGRPGSPRTSPLVRRHRESASGRWGSWARTPASDSPLETPPACTPTSTSAPTAARRPTKPVTPVRACCRSCSPPASPWGRARRSGSR